MYDNGAAVEPVAARELLEVEVLAHGTAQVLGLRVVLSGDGLATDVVVRAGRIVGKVAHASGSGGVVQAEGVLRLRQGSRLIAGHLGHIHAVAEIRIVGRLDGARSAMQDLADALVVLVTVDGVGQAGVVGQRSAGGTRLRRLAGGTGVLRLVHTGTGCGMEDQLVGAVGLDLIVGPAEDVAAAVAAAGIHDEGAIRLVGAQVLWLLDKSTRIRTDGIRGQDAATQLLVVVESCGTAALLQDAVVGGTAHPAVAGVRVQEARVLRQQLAHIVHRQVLKVLDHAAQGAGHKQQRQDTAGCKEMNQKARI